MANKYDLWDMIKVYGVKKFYPLGYHDVYTGNPNDYPGSYAMHHWVATWKDEYKQQKEQ